MRSLRECRQGSIWRKSVPKRSKLKQKVRPPLQIPTVKLVDRPLPYYRICYHPSHGGGFLEHFCATEDEAWDFLFDVFVKSGVIRRPVERAAAKARTLRSAQNQLDKLINILVSRDLDDVFENWYSHRHECPEGTLTSLMRDLEHQLMLRKDDVKIRDAFTRAVKGSAADKRELVREHLYYFNIELVTE
jgi:hypothetical protein